ncbi:MAG: ABC transporter permease [Clostridia bacterium]|nr:ABC transporter permease [Clostridia bacterium]
MKNKNKASVNLIHFKVCVRRYYQLIFSDKVSATMLLLQAPLMLIVLSLIIPKECFANPARLYMADNAMFIIVVMCTMMGLLNSYREVCKERTVLSREYDAGLDMTAYVLSKVFVLGSICLVQSLIMCVGSYLIIDFPSPFPVFTEVLYWLVLFLVLLVSSVTGIFISSVLKSSDSAILPVLVILIMQIVMSGNIITLEGALKVISVACVSRWGLCALGQVFNRNHLFPSIPSTVRDFYDHTLLACILIMLLIIVVLIFLSVVVLKFSFRKKYKKN